MTGKDSFKDNARRPIVAWDFDGTLVVGNHFPRIGEPRRYAKEVMNFLHEVGVINIIWTCRDKSPNEYTSTFKHNDITPMVNWLIRNGYQYDGVNTVIKHAPFQYEARKIYAHMYVDDKAFGWYESEDIMLDVLRSILVRVLHVGPRTAKNIVEYMRKQEGVDEDVVRRVKDIVRRWGMQ